MSDRQDVTETLTAVAATARSGVIDTSGKRDIVFSVEFSTVAAGAGDTIDVIVQHTNADSGTYGGSTSDNYWETFNTFAQVAGNATTPYIRHMDMSQSLLNATTTNVRRSIGRWARWKYTVAGGTAAFTGKLRMSYNVAITQ